MLAKPTLLQVEIEVTRLARISLVQLTAILKNLLMIISYLSDILYTKLFQCWRLDDPYAHSSNAHQLYLI